MQKINAIIEDIKNITPKIKQFRIRHNHFNYHFKPGQWIDLFIDRPGKNIGGYTIISNPKDIEWIELAIRESSHHPVTQYLHHEAKIGDQIAITEGQGKFYLKDEWINKPKIFIAGGIGLTPLLSMIRSSDNRQLSQLYYSVSEEDEIMFREELSDIAYFTVTKKHSPNWKGGTERLCIERLGENLKDSNSQYFLCGPRPMIDSLSSELKDFGIKTENIHYEKWW